MRCRLQAHVSCRWHLSWPATTVVCGGFEMNNCYTHFTTGRYTTITIGPNSRYGIWNRVTVFLDEALFTRAGMHDVHYMHVWSYDNPHATDTSGYRVRFSANVRLCELVGDMLLGPHFLRRRLTGDTCGISAGNII
ncbi:hypothetical protein PR048_021043 [Dryococelus australis]|uniref:Uncharacterized protein n=1 Tax=Dryococelus australis TaxID=614101 RepID=A0ABQ9GX41_9NEOP|nr:hypothetical protein PR048_021043 [Dryococelus australis]